MPVCSAVFSAGAITSANMIGVSSGTTSSRGVRAVSWKRRRASVASGPSETGVGRGVEIAISAVDKGFSFQAAAASESPVRRR